MEDIILGVTMAPDETGKGTHFFVTIQKQKFDEILQQAAISIQSKIRDELEYHLSTKEDQEKIDQFVTEIFDVWTGAYRRIIEISQEMQAMSEDPSQTHAGGFRKRNNEAIGDVALPQTGSSRIALRRR